MQLCCGHYQTGIWWARASLFYLMVLGAENKQAQKPCRALHEPDHLSWESWWEVGVIESRDWSASHSIAGGADVQSAMETTNLNTTVYKGPF